MTCTRAALRWLAVLGGGLCASCLAADPNADGTELEPDCTRNGVFSVELGEDLDGFTPVLADGEPMLVHGAQGGTHLALAAHLLTPDPLEHYEVTLTAEIASEPCIGIDGDFVTVGGFTDLRETSLVDDGVEILGLVLIVDRWDYACARRLTLDIVDACDRTATVVHTFGFDP